jgi:carbonic anhydrase/acetyltransferase-like protein (isoleucine patch superfamily)
VGARSLITQDTRIPPGSLVLGAPAKVVRPLTPAERAALRASAEKYVLVTAHYLSLRDK